MDSHEIDAVFDTGDDWKLICSCGWEAWGFATEAAVRVLHAAHVRDPEADMPVTVLD